MFSINAVLLLLCIACKSDALLCYNGTFTYKTHGNDPVTFKGLSEPSPKQMTRLRCWLTIPCMGGGGDETPMCFVRSWRARSRHAWIVQRGCYLSTKADALPKDMSESTRSMTCMRRRLIDAEYKVCLCQSDWCNSTPTNFKPKELYLLYWSLGTLAYINLSNCIF